MKVMPVIKDIHKTYFYQNCESCISQVFYQENIILKVEK